MHECLSRDFNWFKYLIITVFRGNINSFSGLVISLTDNRVALISGATMTWVVMGPVFVLVPRFPFCVTAMQAPVSLCAFWLVLNIFDVGLGVFVGFASLSMGVFIIHSD